MSDSGRVPVSADNVIRVMQREIDRLRRIETVARTLAELLRDAIGVVHQADSVRRHADPNDKTGWNVHGIETCEDSLCVDALAALAALGQSENPDA